MLVKATGRDSAARDPAVMSRFGDPQALVQQFRRDGSGNLWVQFDAAAIRRGLNAAGLPVWGDDRPATVVWLAYDTGSGERDVLAGGGTDGTAGAALRRDLLEGAAARAVPVVLPLAGLAGSGRGHLRRPLGRFHRAGSRRPPAGTRRMRC